MFEPYNIKQMQDVEIRQAFGKLFITKEGKIALSFLRKMTIERYLGPNCTTEELRHLEGQRHLVSYIQSLAGQD